MTSPNRALSFASILLVTGFCQSAPAWQAPARETAPAVVGAPGIDPCACAPDGLVAYGEDLSRLQMPLPASIGSRRGGNGPIPEPATAVRLTVAEFRALFRQPEFNRTDGLAAYHDDPAWRPRGQAVKPALAVSDR